MTGPIDPLRAKILRQAFRMPSVQDMMSRKSSITNAFANAIVPGVEPTVAEIDAALNVLGIDPVDLLCAFCGDRATEWDHLQPLVLNRRATGNISEIANLVPACGKCNQSKGNKPWKTWMLSTTRHSPTGKKVADVAERIARLEAYERWREPRRINIESIIGAEEWKHYWELCDAVIDEMRQAQNVANHIRERVKASLQSLPEARQIPPLNAR